MLGEEAGAHCSNETPFLLWKDQLKRGREITPQREMIHQNQFKGMK